MANISIDIGANGARIQAAFAAQYGYQPTIDGQPNPETLGQFTKRKIAEYAFAVTAGYEENRDAEIARAAAKANAAATLIIT